MTLDTAPTKASALLGNLLRDAVEMANSGFASVADIDTAMKLGAGHPQGAFAYLATLPDDDLPTGLGSPSANPAGTAAGASVYPTGATNAGWSGPVGVLGTGHMAAGIVECVARAGRQVKVLSRRDESSVRLMDQVGSSLDRAIARGRLDAEAKGEAIARIGCTTRAADLAECPLVIEAVAEALDVKRSLLRTLDEVLPPMGVIATNTSSYRVAEVGQEIAQRRPVIALHFFNPAPAMKLVEIVVPAAKDRAEPVDRMAGEVSSAAAAFVRELGKVPVTCGDERGFIVNRLLIPYLNDAVAEVERGVDPAVVDLIMQEQAAHPMGPLALIDLIGVDVTVAALNAIHESVRTARTAPRQALLGLFDRGELGRKTGRGFFNYDG